jgi:hypothetical protein
MKNKTTKDYLKLITKIESFRSNNNKNWMNILRTAFIYAPKKTAKIMSTIYKVDKRISELAKKLTK